MTYHLSEVRWIVCVGILSDLFYLRRITMRIITIRKSSPEHLGKQVCRKTTSKRIWNKDFGKIRRLFSDGLFLCQLYDSLLQQS